MKRIPDLQQRTTRATLRDGNFCIMVVYDFDRQKIMLNRERWWNGKSGVFIGYDMNGNMLYAVKEWNTPLGKRRTIYYEGAVERYFSTNGITGWVPFLLPTEAPIGSMGGIQTSKEPIPIATLNTEGEPQHIPFIHYSNPGEEEHYGSSIFSGGIIGGQDQVNDTQWDIMAASRTTAFQRTWSKGYQLKKNSRNQTIPLKTGPGQHYHANEADAAWGVIEGAKLDGLIAVLESKRDTLCLNTGTPNAIITGNWPSGEALYRMEKPIYGATSDRQMRLGPAWIEMFHRSMELANIYDKEGLNEELLLTAVWKDAGDRDPLSVAMTDLTFWQAAEAAVNAGMPLETFLRVAGWGDDKLKGMSTDVEAQIRARQADLLAIEKQKLDAKQVKPNNTTGQRKPSDNPRAQAKS